MGWAPAGPGFEIQGQLSLLKGPPCSFPTSCLQATAAKALQTLKKPFVPPSQVRGLLA